MLIIGIICKLGNVIIHPVTDEMIQFMGQCLSDLRTRNAATKTKFEFLPPSCSKILSKNCDLMH